VVLRNQGAYAKLDEAFGRLYAWMAARGASAGVRCGASL